MKKIIIITLLATTSITVLFFLWRFISYLINDNPNKTFLIPQIESTKVTVRSLSSSQSQIVLDIHLKNHLPFTLRADSLKYNILVDGQKLISGSHKESVYLKWGSKNRLSLPMTLFKDDFKDMIEENKQKDSVEYQLKFSFVTRIIGKRKVTLNIKQTLPLFHFPEVETKFLGIDSVQWKKTAVKLLVSVHNNNIFSMHAKDISYRFTIDGLDWIEGDISGQSIIEAKSTTNFEIPVDIPYGKLSKTFFKLLKKGNDLKYTLEVRFAMGSGKYFISEADVVLTNSGSVKELLKAD